jgi:sec-independent protein translocase protein TatA
MKLDIILGVLGGLGAPELMLIIALALLMFGGKKIPELMKGLGQGVKEFKDASKSTDEHKDGSTPNTPVEKK